MKRETIQGAHRVEVLDAKRRPRQVELQLRYSRMTVHPPIGEHKKVPFAVTDGDMCVGTRQAEGSKADLLEIAILHHLVGGTRQAPPKSVAHYLLAIAKLGGYLHRKNDGPPGNIVL